MRLLLPSQRNLVLVIMFCCGTANAIMAQQPGMFDTFGRILLSDERARLDNLAIVATGHKVDLDAVVKDPMEAWEWNLKRSDDNISPYYTEHYHRKWLIVGATETPF